MSWKAVQWAKTWAPDLTTAESYVLFMIAEHFNEDADKLRAWPSATTLERITGLGRSTVFRSIRSLEAMGLVEIEHWKTVSGRRRTSRYYLPLYNSRSVREGKERVVRQYFGNDGKLVTEDERVPTTTTRDLVGTPY